MEKRKTVYQLDTPYSAVSWPSVAPDDQETILELLCALLAPLGQYRSAHLQPSKGKRDRKRKRKAPDTDPPEDFRRPPMPELQSYVDVGLSSVTRTLQEIVSKGQDAKPTEGELPAEEPTIPHYSVIFVARSGQPNALHGHLPQMVAAASKARPSKTPVKLVGLSKSCGDGLSESLGIPRVSCIGLREEAPNSKALVEFIRRSVPAIDAPWLDEAQRAEHLGTKIREIQTSIGRKRAKPRAA
ncbi:hypothetical protein GGR52DRAFT_529308 [Hypoxylon sp. FL1284]|nr:hypothetical protein GGR52DRAFT_529308 [Hypoxylon sp. FL1284]